MTIGLEAKSWRDGPARADFQFFDFRASNIFKRLASPFSNVPAPELTSAAKRACSKRSDFAPESN